MNKILIIAPYEGLKNLFQEVISKNDIKNAHVYSGELKDGVRIVHELEEYGYEVIISRGATAEVIRREVSIPVIEVEISGYDILRTLQLVEGYPDKIGLMSYLNVISGIESVGKLLHKDFSLYPIIDEREIEEQLEKATRDGIKVIIGDSFSASHAEKHGIKSVLLSSGEEAIIKSLKDAQVISTYLSREKNLNKYLKSIIDNDKEKVIVIDDAFKIRYMNKKAEDMFVNLESYIGKEIKVLGDDFKLLKNHVKKDNIKPISFKFENKNYYASIKNLKEDQSLIGFKINLIEAKYQDIGYFIESDYSSMIYLNDFVQESVLMEKIIENAMKISNSNEPVIIYGEQGTGKSELARAIHNESSKDNINFSYLNCKTTSSEKLNDFFVGVGGGQGFAGVFEKVRNGTVYLDNVDTLSLPLQLILKKIINNNFIVRKYETQERKVYCRVIMGAQKKFESKVISGNFDKELYRMINQYSIQIPPLREHKEDIEGYIRWFIANYNRNSGKQLVGLTSDLDRILNKYPWPGNIVQLKYTIEKICEMSKGPYVETKEVSSILNNLKQEVLNYGNTKIDISNKTLEQIELEVIEKVFNLENQNQSNVSKKLNISRSTLWRKLNKLP